MPARSGVGVGSKTRRAAGCAARWVAQMTMMTGGGTALAGWGAMAAAVTRGTTVAGGVVAGAAAGVGGGDEVGVAE